MHSILSLYLGDVIEGPTELPRSFTTAVSLSIFAKDSSSTHIQWGDFITGFPMAVRQRKVLWDTFCNQNNTKAGLLGKELPEHPQT